MAWINETDIINYIDNLKNNNLLPFASRNNSKINLFLYDYESKKNYMICSTQGQKKTSFNTYTIILNNPPSNYRSVYENSYICHNKREMDELVNYFLNNTDIFEDTTNEDDAYNTNIAHKDIDKIEKYYEN